MKAHSPVGMSTRTASVIVAATLVLTACASAADPVSTTGTTASTTASSPETTAPDESAVASAPSPEPSESPAPFPVEAFAAISEEPVPEELAAEFQATLEIVAAGGGIAATVMTPDGTWSGAFGKADGVDDVVVDSQFGIGSVTKSIVAAQVMQLVEAGEIVLDAPAREYLPSDFAFDHNGATIRQLLSHRSGLPDWYSDMEESFKTERTRVWKLDEVLALVDPALFEAGVAHAYADTNYNLLGLVIEQVRGRPLVEVLRDGVLSVEGTDRLIYQPDEAPTDPMAMPLGEPRDAFEMGGGYLPSISDASSGGPAGGMASDSMSLARWWWALCAGEIVSQASLTEMAAFYDGPDPYGLGLANFVGGAAESVGHLGSNFGYRAAAGCVTEEPVVVVVLTNQQPKNPGLAVALMKAALSD